VIQKRYKNTTLYSDVALSIINDRVFEEKKRRNLAVQAKTPRLNRFFQHSF